MNRVWIVSIGMLLFGLGPLPFLHADEPVVEQVGIDERLGETIPLGLVFKDENGKDTTLAQIIEKPTILSLVYFSCPGICSPLLNAEAKVLGQLPMRPGSEYQALSISFDPRDTPEIAKQKKQNYLQAMRPTIDFDAKDWRFLTGSQENIRRLTNAVGFRYMKDGEDFRHAGTLIVLSPSGKISRYIYGLTYLPLDLKMALLEASEGRIGPTIAKALEFCFSYDPVGKKYTFNILRVVGSVMLLTLLLFLSFLLLTGKRGKRV